MDCQTGCFLRLCGQVFVAAVGPSGREMSREAGDWLETDPWGFAVVILLWDTWASEDG